ncbi:hypothetical protein EN45_064050 [Penicillium chrysogenum]|uniref:DUF7703 domain-containing protein n=1 Tax=Penicillium chrysogenum TaxID=5076 RepID=A0A167T3F4_PENCH|nr:hypothetical protein EN45_064050 [Penicillium chrysogenum]
MWVPQIISILPACSMYIPDKLDQTPREQENSQGQLHDRMISSSVAYIYIYEAVRASKIIITIRGRDGRNAIIHLFCINILVVILNVLLLLAEYKLHYIQVSFKTVVYSIKLKLEFSVLNRLRLLTSTNPCVCQHGPEDSRRSNDNNIFGMASSQSVVAPAVSSQSGATQTEGHSNTLSSGPSGTLPALELSLSQFSPKFDV